MGIQLAVKKKLSLKLKEKILLRLALYQFYFLDRIPLYALANEMMQLANQYCHPMFSQFLNAVMRKLPDCPLSLPKEDTNQDLSIRYSYPLFFVEHVRNVYGLEKIKEILSAGNQAAKIMARIRSK